MLAINFLAMPAEEYVGDAMAVRVETTALLNRGKWSVPEEVATNLGDRGQYFFQNSSSGLWYPKYGVLNTLIYLPCLALAKLTTGSLTFESNTTYVLNLFNLLLSGATAWYLALLGRRYTKSAAIVWLFVLSCFYATFWWNYLRAQTFETYVTLFMVAFYYHFVSTHPGSLPSQSEEKRARCHLFLAATFLSLLCLCKTVYVILWPIALGLLVLFPAPSAKRSRLMGEIFCLAGPMLAAGTTILITNWARFGSPFSTGYTQWEAERQLFTLDMFPALGAFLFGKQRSVFLHFPVLIFALAGWPILFRKYRFDAIVALLLGVILLAVNSARPDWRGGACYGPRYLLPVLPLLSLPFVCFASWVSTQRSRLIKFGVGAVVAAALFYSSVLQIGVNSLPFFFCYDLRALRGNEHSVLNGYLYSHHFGTINIDFLRYARGMPSPLTNLAQNLEPFEFAELEQLKAEARLNYFWFPNSVEPKR